nr:glutathione S-transferase Mu 1 isoform X1 [Equus caballus]
MAMTLGYWDIRGLAHAIRLLLEYTDSNYEEKKYTMGDAPDYDRSQWLSEKFKLGLDFPNLPYLIDGAHKLTQSNAILRYIARKHNLCGETEEEKIRVDILENEIMDTRMALARLCYNPDFGTWLLTHGSWGSYAALGRPVPLPRASVSEGGDSCFVPQEKLKPEYLEALPETVKLFSQFLGKRPWFAGDKITFVDFLAYDLLDRLRMFEPKCLDAFPNLKDFIARFEGLKKISAYMKTSRFLPKPLFLKIAVWGNK